MVSDGITICVIVKYGLVLILVLMDMGLVPVILQLIIAQRIMYSENRNFTYPNNKKCIFMLQKYNKKRIITNIYR